MKDYKLMNQDEQARWVADFADFVETTFPQLQQRKNQWDLRDIEQMRRVMNLLTVFPFARKFAEQALRYGDFAARFSRLGFYLDLAKKELAAGLAVTTTNGERFVIIDPTVPARRRGRPTKEEVAARLKGEIVVNDDPGMEQQRRIARLLGLNVVVSNNHPREKNNAELAADRAQRQAEAERKHPSLFAPAAAVPSASPAGSAPGGSPAGVPAVPAVSPAGSVPGGSPAGVPAAPAVSPSEPSVHSPAVLGGASSAPIPYTPPMEYRLHIDQKAMFLPKPLADRALQIRNLRTLAGNAAEKAKTLADLHRPAEEIEPFAKEAAARTDEYMQIYADIDDALATVFFRLQNDQPYRDRFCQRFGFSSPDGTVNPTAPKISDDLMHDLRMHYNKVKSPEFDHRIRTLIEQESPEYAARMKAEQEKKEEVAAIRKYLSRRDKPNTLVRISTMKERYARLVELTGEEEASAYLVFINKAQEDYDQNFRAADEAKEAEKQKASEKKAEKQNAKKQKKTAK